MSQMSLPRDKVSPGLRFMSALAVVIGGLSASPAKAAAPSIFDTAPKDQQAALLNEQQICNGELALRYLTISNVKGLMGDTAQQKSNMNSVQQLIAGSNWTIQPSKSGIGFDLANKSLKPNDPNISLFDKGGLKESVEISNFVKNHPGFHQLSPFERDKLLEDAFGPNVNDDCKESERRLNVLHKTPGKAAIPGSGIVRPGR